MVVVRPTGLDGVLEIVPTKIGDERGFFSESFNAARLAEHGIYRPFVQDNHSYSRQVGVLRGLHYQLPPKAQDKLVRVTRGRVFDVAVDIRKGSRSYGQWVGIELSADKWNQLFVPRGFAHGFLTLEPDTEFLYKVSATYCAQSERSIRFDDPEIGIDWPGEAAAFVISEKDRNAPFLKDVDAVFSYGVG